MSHDSAYAQKKLLSGCPVRVIFDVGANAGQSARAYAADYPSALIYSFEPFDESYAQLSQFAVGAPNVRPNKIAIADAPGTRQFFVNEGSQTNSLLATAPAVGNRPEFGLMQTVRTVEVPIDTIDAFCNARSIDHIDILKMDIQGGELMALKGASAMLARRAVSLVYCEVLFATLYTGQSCFCDIVQEMRSHGYALFGIYNGRRPPGHCLAWADAIFLSPDLASDGKLIRRTFRD